MMDKLTTSQLAQLAADVHSSGGRAEVFEYWYELGEMIAAIATQARGWRVGSATEEGASLMAIPEDSAVCALCQVCDLVRPRALKSDAWLTDGARATLAEHFKGGGEHDPVARAARLIARAWVAPEDLSPDGAARVTTELCESAAAVAIELEASWSPEKAREALDRDDPTLSQAPELETYHGSYPRLIQIDYQHVRDEAPGYWSPYMIVGLLGETTPPSPGEEERALAHCALLAQGRLLPGPRGRPAHPRYQRGSLRSRPGWPTGETIMGALLESLERQFTPTWWLGRAEHIELAPQQIRCVSIAGWKRERFASSPRCVHREWHTVPSQSLPDWVCDQVTPRTSAGAQQSNQSLYQRAGVPWYWIVDLRDSVVRVMRLVADEYRVELVADGTSCVVLPPFESVEIDLKATFPPRRWGGARSLKRGSE